MALSSNTVFNLVATGLAAYGGYMLFTEQDGASQNEMLKYISSVVGGLGYLIYMNKEVIFAGFQKRRSSDRVFSPADFEEQDFKCLVHLRNRVTEAGSEEGIKVCEELNKIVFSLHAREHRKVLPNVEKK